MWIQLSLSVTFTAPAPLPLSAPFLRQACFSTMDSDLLELCCHGDVLSVRQPPRCGLKQPVINIQTWSPHSIDYSKADYKYQKKISNVVVSAYKALIIKETKCTVIAILQV